MATRTFRGTIDADWNTAGNWLELAVPLIGDDVVFDAASPACTLSGAGDCLTLDCTGFAATITPGANTLTVAGTVFKLVAGCWVAGTCLVDFTATAGTVLITTAGNSIYNIRAGNGGAGGTFQPQDALTVSNDLDIVRGTFDFNNQTATMGRDLLIRSTVATGTILLSSNTISIARNLDSSSNNPTNSGGSTVKMTGTGQIINRFVGNWSLYLNNLEVAFPGQVTTFTELGTGSTAGIYVFGALTAYTGTLTNNGISRVNLYVNSTGPAIPLNMDANTIVNFNANTMTIQVSDSSYTRTLLFPATPNQLNVSMHGRTFGGYDAVVKLGRSTSLGNVYMDDLDGRKNWFFDLNGFNLICTDLAHGTAYLGGPCLLVNNSTFTVNGNAACKTIFLGGPVMVIGPTGVVSINGNFTLNPTGGGATGIQMSTGSLFNLTGNWTSNAAGSPANSFLNSNLGTVNLNGPGAFSIATRNNDPWPTVRISGGGTVTLPANFNCYSLLVTNGTVTTGGDLTVRNSYNVSLGASMTLTGNVFIGSSFINTGTVITTGSNIVTTGAACSIQGVNPATLTMSANTIRLQLLSAAVTVTSLIFQDRQLPGVCQFKAAGTFTIGTLNSQITRGDCPVQLISSTAGTKYTLKPTVVTSVANLWPRDCITTLAITGNLSNVNLGNNSGWTLNQNGVVRIITDDPGDAELAAAGFGLYEYCWLVSTTLVGLGTLVTNFAAGANNWHRRTSLPMAYLDNLSPGTLYYIALGLRDERDRRLAPVIGSDDYATGYPALCGGGDSDNIVNTSCNTYGG